MSENDNLWSAIEDVVQGRGLRSLLCVDSAEDEARSKPERTAAAKQRMRAARSMSRAERKWLAVQSLEELLLRRRPGDKYVAEFCVSELGQDAGLRLLKQDDADDELADGVARGWCGKPDRLFEALRNFPREDVRKRLCCLVPAQHPHDMPVTRLDSRLASEQDVETFSERCLPSLVCDRSKEVRRLARLARRLTRCAPGLVVPYHDVSLRRLEQRALRNEPWFGTRTSTLVVPLGPELSPQVEDICAKLDSIAQVDALSASEVVVQALGLAAQNGISVRELDALEVAILDCEAFDWDCVLGTPALEWLDGHFALALLTRTDAPSRLHRALAPRVSASEEIAAELVFSRSALADRVLRATLASCDWPHVLFAMVMKGAHEVGQRAFEKLVTTDVDRALRVVSELPTRAVQLDRIQWRDLLESCSPRDRVRLRDAREQIQINS